MKKREFYIDSNRLHEGGACIYGVHKFEKAFGTTGRILFNPTNWEKARKADLNLIWLASRILGWEAFSDLEDRFVSKYTYQGTITKRFSTALYNAVAKKLEEREDKKLEAENEAV